MFVARRCARGGASCRTTDPPVFCHLRIPTCPPSTLSLPPPPSHCSRRTSEHTVNIDLARLLRGKHPCWRQGIGVEQSGVLADAPGQRPDILIQHAGGMPVVIETEYDAAR